MRSVDTGIRVQANAGIGSRCIVANPDLPATPKKAGGFRVDNTNLTAEMRSYFIAPARAAGFRVLGYYLRCDVSVALSRNSKREELWRVPDKGLLGSYKQLQLPSH